MKTGTSLEFIKLVSKSQIRSPELRKRAKAFPGRTIDLRYLVRRSAEEIAFLWYMAFPGETLLKIHEMYILKEFRGQGIGLHLIAHAEQLAMRRDYQGLILTAVPLDLEIDIKRLVTWYKKHGFTEKDAERKLFCKFLVPR